MKIVGLLIARDEEICIGMTIDTVHTIVDEIVFVNNASKDRTAEIVREKCKQYNIKLHELYAGLENYIIAVRKMCLDYAWNLDADYFFTIDGDMIYYKPEEIRKLAEKGEYDQYWFVSMNICGDLEHSSGLNIPHLYMHRKKDRTSTYTYENYCVAECTHPCDPNKTRFHAWNLRGIKPYDHIFWMYQQKFCRAWNKIHPADNYSTEQYIQAFFGGKGPDEQYKKVFALNRLKLWGQPIYKICEWYGMDEDGFRMKYMDYPQFFKDWKMPFELLFDLDGTIMSRKPDLMDVPVLPDKDIYQLRPEFLKEMDML